VLAEKKKKQALADQARKEVSFRKMKKQFEEELGKFSVSLSSEHYEKATGLYQKMKESAKSSKALQSKLPSFKTTVTSVYKGQFTFP